MIAASSLNQILDGFRKAMADAGVPFGGPIVADGDKVQRFTVDGDRRNSMTGWYVLYTDGVPAGEFGCWKRGVQMSWCAKRPNELTPAERDALHARNEAARAARAENERRLQAEAASYAGIVWDAAEPAVDHPYLERKGVRPHGTRVGRWVRHLGDREVVIENALLVPVRIGKKIMSLQAIFPARDGVLGRDKDFLPGGMKRGGTCAIGRPEGERDTIVICEGFATGATIHEATGLPVVVAFDAGNLRPAAERVRARYPSASLVVAGDNDRWTMTPMENPGAHFARMAGAAVGARVVLPEFRDLEGRPTDFNDLAAAEGAAAVAAQLRAPADGPAPVRDDAANDNAPAVAAPPPAYQQAAVDWFTPFPDINGKGKPLSTIENVVEACNRLGVTVRYNVISKDIEVLVPGGRFTVDNEANASLAWLMSACARFGLPTDKLGDFLCYIADQNCYNPAATWIESKPWDRGSRLAEFFATVTAEGEAEDDRVRQLKEAMILRWMLSAVAAAFRPNGVSAHGILVFQGPQYLGKTAWFKRLAPESLHIIQDGLILRPDDRDSVRQAVGNWLVELGELDATFRRSDIAQLKAFITRDRDVLRRAYARLESHYARRTVFFASVNPRQFLHDPTGNRRYWTISCAAIDHRHDIDMQQLWAEVLEAYRAGESWYLTPDEMAMLNAHNADFETVDPIRERILSRYDWRTDRAGWRWVTATDVLAEIGFDRPQRGDATQAGLIIGELNGGARRRSQGRNLLLCPPKPVSEPHAYG